MTVLLHYQRCIHPGITDFLCGLKTTGTTLGSLQWCPHQVCSTADMACIAMLFVIFAFALMTAFALPFPHDSLLAKRLTHTGRGTWFNVGEGNCGEWNVNSDKIIALSMSQYGSGENCGQWAHITNVANDRSVYAMVRDSCQSCQYGDIDMSPGAFQDLASLSQGEIEVSWNFMSRDWSP